MSFFFDALTMVGPRPKKPIQMPWRLEDVLSDMELCSISGALVASTMSVNYEPMYANRQLCDWLKAHDHLFPVWNVMPAGTGEFPAPRELEKLLRQHNVRAVTICPVSNGWDWFGSAAQPLLRWLAQKKVLTILHHGEVQGDWPGLDQFLAGNRRLPVLLTGASWASQRFVIPLLEKYSNLHITFDSFQINYGIEDLVARGLENQLLFGSNAPVMSIGAQRAYIDYAAVPAKVRAKIAGGNLIRLLHGQRPPRERENKSEDKIMAAARRGEPLPVPVIDFHMHILREGMQGGGGRNRMTNGGPKGTFAMLQRFGCVGGGFMSWDAIVGCDSEGGNACVKEALDAAPRGYWGLGTFNPTHFSQDEMRRQIRELYQDRRFIGMKPYHTYGLTYDHPRYDCWWEYGNAHQLYAGIHRNRLDFSEVNTLAKKYPRVRWVVYHCGMRYDVADAAIECMKQFPNVYAELTYTSVTAGVIEYLVQHAGADRVVYGSDLPMRDPRQQLGWVVYTKLPVAVKARLLAGNALQIIKPNLPYLPPHNRPAI
ncbi:MAG: hypothetical protein PCFJNLEI_02113 [Verrucomicrobiae bacterium]|nr:hypothetical protein [Verrucomicrobiae bacterium]